MSPSFPLPRRPAGQRLAGGSEDDVASDDGEHPPHGQKTPPVQFDGEVKRNHPHLDQSHQLLRTETVHIQYQTKPAAYSGANGKRK